MNQKTLLLLMAMSTSTLFAQEKSSSELTLTKTESNGVRIYEAPGNNNPVSVPPSVNIETRSERTIADWDLEECESVLYHIDLKIEKLKETETDIETEQLDLYQTQRAAIIARIELLSNTTK